MSLIPGAHPIPLFATSVAMGAFLQSIHTEILGSALVGFLAMAGFLYKNGLINWPGKATPEIQPVSKREFEGAIASIRAQLDEVATMASEAKSSADAAAMSLQSIATTIDTSMRLLGERFESATARLEKTADRMLDRLDNQDVRLATVTARVDGHVESSTQFRESLQDRLASVEESLRKAG